MPRGNILLESVWFCLSFSCRLPAFCSSSCSIAGLMLAGGHSEGLLIALRRQYSRVTLICVHAVCLAARGVSLRISSSSALDNSASHSVRMRFVGWSLEEIVPGRQQAGNCAPGFLDSSSVYTSRQGSESCGGTYHQPFPSFLLLTCAPRATPLRLCVSPAVA